jgi:phage terminase large subunit-like protein
MEGIEKPTIDLSLMDEKIRWLLDNFAVIGVFYDSYQLHSIMTKIHQEYDKTGTRKLVVEVPQNSGRILSDQYLYQSIVERKLRHNNDPVLREHVLNAVASESEKGFRLDKERTSNKIDAAVACAMSIYGSSTRFRPKRTFVRV